MHIKQIPRIKSGILIPLELRVELLELRMEFILKLTKYHTWEKADVKAASPRHILVKQLDFED